MSHLKTAYLLGVRAAYEQFEKQALGSVGKAMLAGGGVGAGFGALSTAASNAPGEKHYLRNMLLGAGIGAGVGGGGAAIAKSSAPWAKKLQEVGSGLAEGAREGWHHAT